MPRGRFVDVPGRAPHAMPYEATKTFVELAADFIDEVEARARPGEQPAAAAGGGGRVGGTEPSSRSAKVDKRRSSAAALRGENFVLFAPHEASLRRALTSWARSSGASRRTLRLRRSASVSLVRFVGRGARARSQRERRRRRPPALASAPRGRRGANPLDPLRNGAPPVHLPEAALRPPLGFGSPRRRRRRPASLLRSAAQSAHSSSTCDRRQARRCARARSRASARTRAQNPHLLGCSAGSPRCRARAGQGGREASRPPRRKSLRAGRCDARTVSMQTMSAQLVPRQRTSAA